MSAKLPLDVTDLKPRITVIGVGGAGCNAINNMIDASLDGVEFVVANTDAQSLVASQAGHKIQLGARLTEGLGAGSRPEIGEAAAEETIDDIREVIRGSHMVFVAAGMGGGTGTGAAAVIARAAKEQNILTVAVVTKPFLFEGARRMRIAEAGIAELRKQVDTLIVIPNQNLFRIASERTTFAEAFVLADQVLYSGVACIVDLIVKEGLINLDFADVRTVMSGMGSAMMGTGEASGESRAVRAAEEAIANPLLDDVTLAGARGLLLSISGGADLTLYEVDEAAMRVRQEVDPDANIIVGATFDPTLGDRVRVSIVASGLAGQEAFMRPAASAAPAIKAASAPPAPAFGSSERDRIAEALKPPHLLDPALGPAATPLQPPPVPAASSWHAADDVEITNLEPGAFGALGYAPPSAYGASAERAPVLDESFNPAPPVEVRRPPRRMPEIEDFPPVGQREYIAKSQRLAEEARGYLSTPAREESEPRRRGLFERLTGRGKRESDSHESGRDPHATTAPRTPSAATSYGVDENARGGLHARREDPSHRSEKPELPAFFTRSRR